MKSNLSIINDRKKIKRSVTTISHSKIKSIISKTRVFFESDIQDYFPLNNKEISCINLFSDINASENRNQKNKSKIEARENKSLNEADPFFFLYDAFHFDSLTSLKKCIDENLFFKYTHPKSSEYFAKTLSIINSNENFFGFYPDPQTSFYSFDFQNINKSEELINFASPTAIAISPTQIFLGAENGDIFIYDFFLKTLDSGQLNGKFAKQQVINSFSSKKKEKFSLLYYNSKIYQIFKGYIKTFPLLNFDTCESIKTDVLRFPSITDGNFFYSFDGKKTINIFSPKESLASKPLRSVVLASAPTNYESLKSIICTNGSVITFGTLKKEKLASAPTNENTSNNTSDSGSVSSSNTSNKSKAYLYRFEMFSLLTGKLIKSFVVKFENMLQMWSFSPYNFYHILIEKGINNETNDLIADKSLSNISLNILSGSNSIPKWIEGYCSPLIEKKSSCQIVGALNNAIFEGFGFLYNEDIIAKYQDIYINIFHKTGAENYLFLKAFSDLFIRFSRNYIKVIEFLSDKFLTLKQINDESILQLTFFLLLFSIYRTLYIPNQSLKSSMAAKIQELFSFNNYLTQYVDYVDTQDIEDKFHSILIFYRIFDFKTVYFTESAACKILKFTFKKYKEFRNESGFIISSFYHTYIYQYFTINNYLKIQNINQYFFRKIQKSYNKYIENLVLCVETPLLLSIWKFYLLTISKSKEIWLYYANDFLKFLEFSFLKNPKQNKNVMFINNLCISRMINYSMLLSLEILAYIQSTKQLKTMVSYKSIDSFYNAQPHPLNNKRPFRELDEEIFKILNRSIEIKNNDEFTQQFFLIRHFILFNKNNDFNLSHYIINRGSSEYLTFNFDPSRKKTFFLLLSCNANETTQNLLKLINDNIEKMTETQKIIISLYIKKLNMQRQAFFNFGNVFNNGLDPFLFSRDMILKYNITLSLDGLLKNEGEVLENNLDFLLGVKSQILFLDCVFNRLTQVTLKSGNKVNYYDLLKNNEQNYFYQLWILFYLSYKNNNKPQLNDCVKIIKAHIKSGSKAVIRMVMKCVALFEADSNNDNYKPMSKIFGILFHIIFNYFYHHINPFMAQTLPSDTIESIFIIIQYLKQMFNSTSGIFRKYLIDAVLYIENEVIQSTHNEKIFETILPMYSILNNSIEIFRSNVFAHIIHHKLGKINGEVINYDSLGSTAKILIKPKKILPIDLSDCSALWCDPPIKVNLKLLEKSNNLMHFIHIFYFRDFDFNSMIKTDFSNFCLINAFRCASLWEFMSSTNFYQFLSPSHTSRILEWRKYASIYFPNATLNSHSFPRFHPEQYINKFCLFISSRWVKLPTFSLFNISNIPYEKKNIGTLCNIQNITQNENENESGMIVTLFDSSTFISTPIHHLCDFNLVLKLLPTQSKSCQMEPFHNADKSFPNQEEVLCDMRICIYGKTLHQNIILYSDYITIEAPNTEKFETEAKEINIEYVSSKTGFIISKNGVPSLFFKGSPAVDYYIILIELSSNNIVEYSFFYENKDLETNHEATPYYFKNEKMLNIFSDDQFPLPIVESSLCNDYSFREAAFYLAQSFSYLISIYEILRSNEKNLIDFKDHLSIFNLLSFIDPIPSFSNDSLSLKKLTSFFDSMGYVQYIHGHIINYLELLNSKSKQKFLNLNPLAKDFKNNYSKDHKACKIMQKLQAMIRSAFQEIVKEEHDFHPEVIYQNNYYHQITTNSKSVLFFPDNQAIHASNIYIFSYDSSPPFKIFGYLDDEVLYLPISGYVIPMVDIFGSPVEILLHLKHYIMISLFLNCDIESEIHFLKEVIQEFNEKSKYLPFVLNEFKIFLDVFQPKIPRKNFFPQISNPISYLISNSLIHENPKLFLLPTYCEYFGKIVNFQNEYNDLSFCKKNDNIYFAIHDKRSCGHFYEFIVNSNIHMKSNSFMILKHTNRIQIQLLSLSKPNSPHSENFSKTECELESSFIISELDESSYLENLYCVICNIPKLEKISNQLEHWMPYHSHQLLSCIKSVEDLSKSNYYSIPLSKAFKYETAKFAYKILDSLMFSHQNNEQDTTFDEALNENANDINKSILLKLEDSHEYSFINSHIIFPSKVSKRLCDSYDNFKILYDVKSMKERRIKFLKENNLDVFSYIDPDYARISYEINYYKDYEDQFHKRIRDKNNPILIFYSMKRSKLHNFEEKVVKKIKSTTHKIEKFLKKAPAFVLLQFIEFCTGKWGTGWISDPDNKIYIYITREKEKIEVYQPNNLLVIGFFHKNTLVNSLLKSLQMYSEQQLSHNE